MNDTLRDHTIETQQTGYDKLASDSKEALDETIQALNANASEQEKIVKHMLDKIKGEYNTAYEEINKLIESTGTAIGTTANDALGPNGLKASVESSLKPIGESVTAWLNDLGKKVEAFNINVSKIADFNTENYMEAQRVSGILKSLKITSTKDDVKNARSEYDKLTDEQKKLVNKDALKALTDNEKRIKDEEARKKAAAEAEARRKADEEIRKKVNDEAAADKVIKSINNLYEKDYTAKDEAKVKSLRKEYNSLTSDQKKLVGKDVLEYLINMEKYIEDQKKQEEKDQRAAAKQQEKNNAAQDKLQNANEVYKSEKNTYKEISQTFGSDSKEAAAASKNVKQAKSDVNKAKAQVNKLAVSDIIDGLSDRSKKVTNEEKKKHSEIWSYIAQKFGKTIHDNQIIQLGDILGVKLSASSKKNNKATDKEKAAILAELKKLKGYSKGTLGTKRDEINWTHQGEIIRMSDGAILRQLPQGTQVIPKLESQNLMKWAQMDPSKWVHDGINTNVIKNNESGGNITVHYDSLLTVNGDVTRDALPELQEILKRSYEYTTAQIKREARKSGIR